MVHDYRSSVAACEVGLLLALCFPAIGGETLTVKVKHQNNSKKWKNYATRTMGHLKGFTSVPVELGQYGGRTDRREKATGFFHVKNLKTGWTLIDPEGYHFVCMGVNSTSPNDTDKDYKEVFKRKYGSRKVWAKQTRKLLRDDLGFNALACWSEWSAFKEAGCPMPYVRRWNMVATYGRKKKITYAKYGHAGFKDDVLPIFDEEFAVFCDSLGERLAETKDDPWLIGHFSDNELPFKEKDMLRRYLGMPKDDAAREAALAWLKKRGKTEKKISAKDDAAFAEYVMATYFRIVGKAIRKHDPNHLILGSRFHGYASRQDSTYKACGPYVDVVSVNYYHRWTPEQKVLDRWAKLAGRPIIITEWYAKGADSGLSNARGAGFTVPTQKDRGLFYQNYTLGLLENRNVVGWHWFRYTDDGPSKTGGSCNKGILNQAFEPYVELSDRMRAVNRNVYALQSYLRGEN